MLKKVVFLKKPLDKSKIRCYNIKSHPSGAITSSNRKKISKKVKKLLQKVLTSGKDCGIISKSLRK